MNIIISKIPNWLRITHTMYEDFICDPVMAAYVIFGYKLDAFQASRLRYYWWVPMVIDSSGFSSGKTISDWLFMNLRCVLVPDHEAAVYYPAHGQGKETFWNYYYTCPGKIGRAQMGQLNKEGEQNTKKNLTESGGTWMAQFLNGNTLYMPAASFSRGAATQASKRFNSILLEEWTHVDDVSDGIDEQIIGRATRQSWNQDHPIWCNHILFTAPAKTRMHKAYNRYNTHQKKVLAGDPTYANLHYSYKDYSRLKCHSGKTFKEEFRVQKTIDNMQSKRAKADWMAEGFGIWGVNGKGWFNEEAVSQCIANGRAANLAPVMNRLEYERLGSGNPNN